MTRLVLIRHAAPAEDMRGRCYGALDVPLSPAGVEQARRLALRLPPLAAVYTSPRLRAMQTATAIVRAPLVDERLRELDFGALEGRTYDEIAALEPELYRRWMETPTDVEFPGGESFALLRIRALAAVDEIRGRHEGESVALVSHGGVLRAILADALEMPAAAIFRLAQDYAAVSVVEWLDGVPVVRLVNGDGGSGL